MTEQIFIYREKSDFDFAQAPVYRKTATLTKANIEIAQEAHDLVTMINGVEETRNRAEPGDHIVTGSQGERYIIKAAKFASLYEQDPSNPDAYISKNVVKAIRLSENTELTAPWGEKQRALAGGVVVQSLLNHNDIYHTSS